MDDHKVIIQKSSLFVTGKDRDTEISVLQKLDAWVTPLINVDAYY